MSLDIFAFALGKNELSMDRTLCQLRALGQELAHGAGRNAPRAAVRLNRALSTQGTRGEMVQPILRPPSVVVGTIDVGAQGSMRSMTEIPAC